jgi:hypothetical protein
MHVSFCIRAILWSIEAWTRPSSFPKPASLWYLLFFLWQLSYPHRQPRSSRGPMPPLLFYGTTRPPAHRSPATSVALLPPQTTVSPCWHLIHSLVTPPPTTLNPNLGAPLSVTRPCRLSLYQLCHWDPLSLPPSSCQPLPQNLPPTNSSSDEHVNGRQQHFQKKQSRAIQHFLKNYVPALSWIGPLIELWGLQSLQG